MAGRVLSKKNESALRDALKALTDVLGQLSDDASDEAKEAWKGVQEAVNLGDNLEARLHVQFVAAIDDLFGGGVLTRDERQSMLGALEMALQSFAASVQEFAPQVYARAPWADPQPDADFGEAAVVESDVIPLTERAVRGDGTAAIKIIQPGWGSSGFYPAEVLERDGPRIFTAGLKSFWNHATPTEDAERPEGDLSALAMELVSDARWEPNHPAGPGLYAETKVFTPYREAVNELAPHIGVSIRALGRATQGEAEGRKGPIIQALTAARSVDLVTVPGAGGRIVEMFESAGRAAQRGRPVENQADSQESEMADKAVQEALARLEQENARLSEAMLLRDARDFVAGRLKAAVVPDVTKARLAESLSANPPVKDGALDTAAFAETIDQAVAAEVEYLKQAGYGAGKVEGMGSNGAQAEPVRFKAQLVESFKAMGLDQRQAEIAAEGR